MNTTRLIYMVLSIFFYNAYAQVETYPVVNFTVNDYGAANQNWGVSIGEHDDVFVANHQGLLAFDGQHWSLHKLPNNTIVRSVLADGSRVYTGSYEEFGYWEQDDFGDYNYTSLTGKIDAHYEFKSEEFWQIVKWKNLIVFRSFTTLYIYDGSSIKVFEPKMVVNEIHPYGNDLLIGTESRGLFIYNTKGVVKRLAGTELLATTSVIDIGEEASGELLIGTKYNGIYTWKEGYLKTADPKLNEYLTENQLNKIDIVNSRMVVFGTIKNGLLFYDRQSGGMNAINRSYGLQNNTVLGITSHNNRLWVAQDNGVSMLNVSTGITFFNDLSGQLGTVYDIENFKNVIFLGSNTGVYYFKNNTLTFLDESQGHVWELVNLGDKLLCCHNSGLYEVGDFSFKQINDVEGTYTVVPIPGKKNEYLAGTYVGLLKLTYINGRWSVHKFGNLNFPISSVVFEDDDKVWCTHPYKGLYRISFSNDFNKADILPFNDHDVKLTDYQTRIHKLNGRIVFYVSNRYYTYNNSENRIIEYKEFSKEQNSKIVYHDNNTYWFINADRNRLIFKKEGQDLVITNKSLLSRITPLYEKVIRANDSVYLIPLNDGYAKLSMPAIFKAKSLSLDSKASLLSLRTDKQSYNINAEITLPFNQARSVTLSFGYPQEIDADFIYELTGPNDQSGNFKGGTIKFQNLTYGTYNLIIKHRDTNREVLSYGFMVAPPWYLTNLMIGVYLIVLVFIIYLIYYYNEKSIRKYHRKISQKMLEEEEKRKARLEKEALQREVEMKQKELMNSTLLISKKNELLLELKNEFKRIKDNPVNEYRVKSLISKTTEAISNKEDWKVFETNFNELHDDFFKKIIKQHPKLTSKDLKLSAYLKMGLMSKEIAPLMGVTTRGIELHRYRLRKKLALDKEQDLIKYLLLF